MARIEDRNHTGAYLARRIAREIWNHPNNRGRRFQALGRSVAWQLRKRSGTSESTRTLFDLVDIWMNPDFGVISNIVYFGDRFDPGAMGFLERYLRPGDTFVDAGANVGVFTLLAAGLVGADGSIHAFEPVPALAGELRRNVALNDIDALVHVHEVALTDHTGELRFRSDRDVASRIAVDDDPDRAVTVVRCGRLDDLLDVGEIAAMKIDVEGAEVAALEGFREHLAVGNPPVVIIEVIWNQLKRQGATVRDLVDLLEDTGYSLARFDPSSGRLERMSHEQLLGDYVAVKDDRWDYVLGRIG